MRKKELLTLSEYFYFVLIIFSSILISFMFDSVPSQKSSFAASGNWTSYRDTSWEGSGTAVDPYLIASTEELAGLAYMVNNGNTYAGKYFEQTQSIDLSAHYWIPIGGGQYRDSRYFSGTYNGCGSDIKGLYINQSSYYCVGLFGTIRGGTVKGINVKSGTVNGNGDVGGIVGYSFGAVSNIIYCSNRASINGSWRVGGILGGYQNKYGTELNLHNCYNAGRISGDVIVGGIIGGQNNNDCTAYIYSCYNIGYISGTGNGNDNKALVGGIIGRMAGYQNNQVQGGWMRNCWNLGGVSLGPQYVGGIAGEFFYCNEGALQNNYWYVSNLSSEWGVGHSAGVPWTTYSSSLPSNAKLLSWYTSSSNWYDRINFGFDIGSTPLSNKTWYLSTYPEFALKQLWFYPEGGSLSASYLYNSNSFFSRYSAYSDYYGKLPSPARTGYTFSGWYNEKTGGARIYNYSSMPTGYIISIYARWKANSYTVKFNGNGSTSGSMNNQSFTYGTAQKLTTNAFKKTGYTFSGWATSSSGGVSYSDGQSVSNLTSTNGGTVNLYAVWTPNIYTISLNKQSGSNGTSTIYLKYNTGWYSNSAGTTSISAITKPTRKGYIFQGYYTSTSGGGSQIINSNGNFVSGKLTYTTANDTLYAYWTPISYSINYELNGGAFGGNSPTNNTQYNTAINVPAPRPPTGYTFAGWSGGTNFNSSTAQSGSESDSMSSWSGSLTKNTYFKNLTASDGVTVTLVANYTANNYTVTFEANGGTVSPTTKSVTYDSTYGDLPTPTRTGYSFTGWTLNGTKITSTTTVKTASNHTLVAQWQAISYTLTFDPNGQGGTVNPTTKSVTFDTTYGTLPTPIRAGYIFIGWYTDKSVGTQVLSTTTVKTASNHSLYAHWQDTWANHTESPSLRVPSNPNNASNPYIIDTPGKLAWLAMQAQTKNLSGYYEQTKNIELDDYIWLPIGTNTYSFTGYYDGKGYTIEGLHTAETTEVSNSTSVNSYVGLFGNTNGAKLNNIYIKGADIKGHTNIGGIVGYASGSTVLTSCGFSGTISAQANSGALIGSAVSGVQITDCIVFSANVDKLNSGSATITNTIYVLNGKKGYSSGEFTNWVYVSGMPYPVPKGLSWLAQGGNQASLNDIQNWTKA